MLELNLYAELLRLRITDPGGELYLEVTGPPRIALDNFLEWLESDEGRAARKRGTSFRSVLVPPR
jgi:hypothetical protein